MLVWVNNTVFIVFQLYCMYSSVVWISAGLKLVLSKTKNHVSYCILNWLNRTGFNLSKNNLCRDILELKNFIYYLWRPSLYRRGMLECPWSYWINEGGLFLCEAQDFNNYWGVFHFREALHRSWGGLMLLTGYVSP